MSETSRINGEKRCRIGAREIKAEKKKIVPEAFSAGGRVWCRFRGR